MDILSIFHIWCSAGTTCVHKYISTSFFFHILHRVNWKWNILSYLWIITFICSSSSTWPFIQSFNYSINQVMKFFVSISCWCQNIILFGIKIRSFFFFFIISFIIIKKSILFYLLVEDSFKNLYFFTWKTELLNNVSSAIWWGSIQ